MKLIEIQKLTEATVVCGDMGDGNYTNAFSSDLMSDVLTSESDQAILITGLVNVQTIRTAEMADIDCILFVRDKDIPPNMLRLAQESDITLLRTKHTMFYVCGVLYEAGIRGVY